MVTLKIDASFFDIKYNREHTGSIKYDSIPSGKRYHDIIPMWIADMDFKIPPEVERALIETSKHGIFGYTDTDATYDEAVVNWYLHRKKWNVQAEWNIKAPGVMFAISAAIRAFTNPGEAVLICQPVYYPFAKIVSANNRKLAVSQLKFSNGKYQIDFDDFEKEIITHRVKLFLLCSPHNPVGRVWSKDELMEIGRICIKHNVLIVSDEIHSDFIYDGFTHTPIASLSEELSERTITCTAPSKTFNLAGLQAANIWVKNVSLRKRLHRACTATGYTDLNTMAITATKAAYTYGHTWLDALIAYLQNNVSILHKALLNSEISLVQPEGTYLMWLDCRRLNLNDAELKTFFLDKAGLLLHNGSTFGSGGSGFMRMNIACPKSVLSEAIYRLLQALK